MDKLMERFEQNQKNLTLNNARIWWMGEFVHLMDGTFKKQLASFRASSNVLKKLARWCVVNSYRCEQVQNGKIVL